MNTFYFLFSSLTTKSQAFEAYRDHFPAVLHKFSMFQVSVILYLGPDPTLFLGEIV